MRRSVRGKIKMWFGFITGLLVLVGSVVYRSAQGSAQTMAWVAHSYQVMATLNDTLSALSTAETAQRGYIITGNTDYLELYYQAVPQIKTAVGQVGTLTVDNDRQQKRIPALKSETEARIATMQRGIILRQRGFQQAQNFVMSGIGQSQTNELHALIAQMGDEERNLLQSRNETARTSANLTLLMSSGGIAISFAMILFMLKIIGHEANERAATVEKLQISSTQLEQSLQQMQRLTGEMTLLGTMSDLMQSCRTAEEAYAIISHTMPQLFPQQTGALYLINSSRNLVESVLSWGAKGKEKPSSQSLFAPDECWALRRSRLHTVHEGEESLLCQHIEGEVPTSYLCLPIAAHGETLGLLYIEKIEDIAASETGQQLVRTVGEQIALSLANLRLQETLRTQSIRDPLTGLFNRRYLEASTERELARAQRHPHDVAVIMMDIDHFKKFNDTFGHEAGDLLLAQFANLLKKSSRSEDIACRYGGEEFVLILPEISLPVVRQSMERLREQAKELQVQYRGQSLGTVTVSMGVAMFPEHGQSIEDLFRVADAALYQAKHAGRDCVVIAESTPQRLVTVA